MKHRFLIVLALVPVVVAATYSPAVARSAPATAMRWKINTHLYAANVALADALNDGMVTIAPFGEFPVAPAALAALRENPAAYRAGVLGPDMFPDMFVGGWFIHSDHSIPEGWISDSWLRHLWARAREWPDATERNKVMAFAYGFLTHGAGDMFAHTWVNEKADGAWVSFEGKDRSTAFKHVVLEGFVGEHTPQTDFSVDVWPRFVSNVLIKDPRARQYSKGVPHYRRWLAISDALEPLIARAKRDMNATVGEDAPYWLKCSTNPKPCARKEYMETWRLDISRGLRAIVDSSESLTEALLDTSRGIADGIGAMSGWATEWVPKMHGLHAVGEGTATLSEVMAWAGQYVPLDSMIKAEVEQFMQRDLPKIWELYNAAKKPSTWMQWPGLFPEGTKQKVEQEMGVAPGGHTFNWRAFEPMYNTVTMSKLVLLDARGLNELARRAGVGAPIVTEEAHVNVMLGMFRSMTHSFQWTGELRKATTKFGICGPETGAPLPPEAVCGNGGFVLYANPEAREKIFFRVFKGVGGAGPGTPDLRAAVAENTVAATAVAGAARSTSGGALTEGRRALRTAMDRAEYMRELVTVMQGKIGGSAPATQAGSLRLGQRGAAPRAAAAPAPTANWGQRCCAKDVAELRASLQAVHAAGSRLQNPALLAQLGRKPSAAQMGARALQANAALGAFATSRDAASAAAALANLSRHIEALAAVVAGTQ